MPVRGAGSASRRSGCRRCRSGRTSPDRKSSVTRRASGITSANDGRSPKPAKWASSGTRARRIASRPLRPTVTTARSPSCCVISRAAKRIVFVLSGPARPRSVVIRMIRRLPPSRSARSGWSSAPRTAARSARTSSSFSAYGREASVASWARRSFEAATNCIARVICLMLRTAPMRRLMSRWLATAGLRMPPRPGRNDCRNASTASSSVARSSSVRLDLSAISVRMSGRSVSRKR